MADPRAAVTLTIGGTPLAFFFRDLTSWGTVVSVAKLHASHRNHHRATLYVEEREKLVCDAIEKKFRGVSIVERGAATMRDIRSTGSLIVLVAEKFGPQPVRDADFAIFCLRSEYEQRCSASLLEAGGYRVDTATVDGEDLWFGSERHYFVAASRSAAEGARKLGSRAGMGAPARFSDRVWDEFGVGRFASVPLVRGPAGSGSGSGSGEAVDEEDEGRTPVVYGVVHGASLRVISQADVQEDKRRSARVCISPYDMIALETSDGSGYTAITPRGMCAMAGFDFFPDMAIGHTDAMSNPLWVSDWCVRCSLASFGLDA